MMSSRHIGAIRSLPWVLVVPGLSAACSGRHEAPVDCADGVDNDEDGLADCSDSDCSPATCGENCRNGVDDDGDGLVDCEDGQCWVGDNCREDCASVGDEDDDGLSNCEDDDCIGTSYCDQILVRVRGGEVQGEWGFSQRHFADSFTGTYSRGSQWALHARSVYGTIAHVVVSELQTSCQWQVRSVDASGGSFESVSSWFSGGPWIDPAERFLADAEPGCPWRLSEYLPVYLQAVGRKPILGWANGSASWGTEQPRWYVPAWSTSTLHTSYFTTAHSGGDGSPKFFSQWARSTWSGTGLLAGGSWVQVR